MFPTVCGTNEKHEQFVKGSHVHHLHETCTRGKKNEFFNTKKKKVCVMWHCNTSIKVFYVNLVKLFVSPRLSNETMTLKMKKNFKNDATKLSSVPLFTITSRFIVLTHRPFLIFMHEVTLFHTKYSDRKNEKWKQCSLIIFYFSKYIYTSEYHKIIVMIHHHHHRHYTLASSILVNIFMSTRTFPCTLHHDTL